MNPVSDDTHHIIIPAGTHITIHDNDMTPDHVHTIIYEIGADAHLIITQEHTYSDTASRRLEYRFILGRSSSLEYALCITGGKQRAITVTVILSGEYAEARVRGMVALSDDDSASVTTIQQHDAPHTTSDVLIHAGVAQAAKLVYSGTITIEKQAPYTVAAQKATVLLLGSKARATAMPSLQVHTNEVRCTHGSAVGRLDEDQLNYLASRGMQRTLAQRILIQGFFADIVQTIPYEMREHWMARVMAKLSGMYE